MLDVLNKYDLIKGTKAFGVELTLNSKDNYVLDAVELIKNKEELSQVNSYSDTTFAALAEVNKKNAPLYLSVDGRGVIHKKLVLNEHTGNQELLHQLLPNASLKDFYLQRVIISDTENWVSIIRKEVLDEVVEEIKKQNLFCVQINLGPFNVEPMLALIEATKITTSNHLLVIENRRIEKLLPVGNEVNNERYLVGGEQVISANIIAFSNAFTHFLPDENTGLQLEAIHTLKEEYYHRNKYITIGFSMLVLFLVITLSNMFMYNHYQDQNNELQFQLNSKQKYITELNRLKEDVKIKEEFVQNSGLTQASKMSYYADQIALGLPESIQLDQLLVNPLEKRIRKAEDIAYNFNKITIAGTVNKSIELNNWVKQLKEYDWIGEVAIVSFLQDNLRSSGDFELEVTIRN